MSKARSSSRSPARNLPLAARTTTAMAFASLALLVLATGCERTHVIKTQCVSSAPTGGQGLTPGERVVARHKEAFREGTVITVQGRLVTVAWDDGSPERSYLPRAWIRSLERRGKVVRKGQWALCRPGAAWELCRVEDLEQDRILASLAGDGERWKLSRRRTHPLPAGLSGWAEERGTELLRKTRRKRMLKRARPGTAGQSVERGQRVLAEWTTDSWWEATVVSVEKSRVVVSWIDSGGRQTVQPSQVAPLVTASPGAGAARLRRGDLAFCKWRGSSQWWQAWIERLSETTARITYRDGVQDRVAVGQCLAATSG